MTKKKDFEHILKLHHYTYYFIYNVNVKPLNKIRKAKRKIGNNSNNLDRSRHILLPANYTTTIVKYLSIYMK